MSPSFFAALRRPAVWALACLSVFASHALAAAPTSVNFGTVPLGQTSTAQTVTVNFSQSGQITAIKAMLQGSTGLDYSATGGSCQLGSTYQAGDSCTVQATFKPLAPGARNGAIVLRNSAGATIATAYLTGIGQGPLATFPGGTPVLAGYTSSNGWTIDGAGNIYYLVPGSPQDVIHKLSPTGGWPFARLPKGDSAAWLQTIDGAGNLYVTYQNQIIKVDASGVVSLLATIQQDPYVPNFSLGGGVAALGNGNLLVGGQSSNGSSVDYYLVKPDGTWSVQGTLVDPNESPSIFDIAIGPSGESYFGSFDSVYNSSSGRICPVPHERGLAVDASGTLLTGTDTNQSYYPNPTANCASTMPVIDQLPFAKPVVDTQGNVYVGSSINPTAPVYKYIRTQLHGAVFSSPGTATSYGSFAITNSGNAPLNLSKLQPSLSGAQSTSFNIEGTTCSQSLAPAATCTISLSYTPSGAYPALPATGSLLLGGFPGQQQVVPLIGFPNQ